MVGPQAKREAVNVLMAEHRFGVTRACGLVSISRSLYRYVRQHADGDLKQRIEDIAALKRRYGYRRVYVCLLRREGWQVNRNACIGCTANWDWLCGVVSANALAWSKSAVAETQRSEPELVDGFCQR